MILFRISLGAQGAVKTNIASCALTIGNFDGLHKGHQAIVKQLKKLASENDVDSCVVLFEPQPLEQLQPKEAPVRLMNLRDKLERLADLGVDQVCCLRFDNALSQLSPEAFVQRILVKRCQARHVLVGADFRFGSQRGGNIQYLYRLGRQQGFCTYESPTHLQSGRRISSTWLREAVKRGDFDLSKRLLGKAFSLAGPVVYGDQLGRQLGFATANVHLNRRRLPLTGVYAVKVLGVESMALPAVANIGTRPTVGGTKPILEVHILGFDGNIYGRRLHVEFYKKMRDEQKFDSVSALQQAVMRDIEAVEYYFQHCQ